MRCGRVVPATNGYADRLHGPLRRSVVPLRSMQGATAPLSDDVRRTVLPGGQVASDTRRLLLHFRLDRDGRLLMGGRGAHGEGGVGRQMVRPRAATRRLFPQLPELAWTHHWGGFVAITADHAPHLHEVEPGVTAGLGNNGRGVTMATAMGRVLADRLTGVPDDALDFPVTPLRPIPFHRLRRPAVSGLTAWYGLRDRLGRRAPRGQGQHGRMGHAGARGEPPPRFGTGRHQASPRRTTS